MWAVRRHNRNPSASRIWNESRLLPLCLFEKKKPAVKGVSKGISTRKGVSKAVSQKLDFCLLSVRNWIWRCCLWFLVLFYLPLGLPGSFYNFCSNVSAELSGCEDLPHQFFLCKFVGLLIRGTQRQRVKERIEFSLFFRANHPYRFSDLPEGIQGICLNGITQKRVSIRRKIGERKNNTFASAG